MRKKGEERKEGRKEELGEEGKKMCYNPSVPQVKDLYPSLGSEYGFLLKS